MRDAFVLALLAGAMLVTMRYPFAGIIGWHWISFLNPHRLTYGFAYTFPIAMAMGGMTILAFILSKEPKKLPSNPLFAIVVALLFWIGVTTLAAHDINWSKDKWETSTKVLIMALLTAVMLTTRERVHALVWVVAITLGYFGVKGGLFTLLTGGAHHVWGPPGTFISDNNQLALALITVMPIFLYLGASSPFRWMRIGAYCAVGLVFFSVLGSQSRGALVGIVAMGSFLVWRTPYKAPAIIATIFLIMVGIWFVPESWVERMETIRDYETDSSAVARIQAWTFAIKLALDNPLTGGGFHVSSIHSLFLTYVPDAVRGRSFHSIWFEMLGAHGFVGLAIFIVMLSLSWLNCNTIRRKTRDVPELRWAFDLASMIQVSLVGYMAAGTFLNLAFFDLVYTIIAIIIGMRTVVERELSGQTSIEEYGARRRRRAGPGPRLAETTTTRAQKPI